MLGAPRAELADIRAGLASWQVGLPHADFIGVIAARPPPDSPRRRNSYGESASAGRTADGYRGDLSRVLKDRRHHPLIESEDSAH